MTTPLAARIRARHGRYADGLGMLVTRRPSAISSRWAKSRPSPPFARRPAELKTIEVEDVRAAGMLAPELETGEPAGAQVEPEGGFGVGAVAAQGTAMGERRIVHALSSA